MEVVSRQIGGGTKGAVEARSEGLSILRCGGMSLGCAGWVLAAAGGLQGFGVGLCVRAQLVMLTIRPSKVLALASVRVVEVGAVGSWGSCVHPWGDKVGSSEGSSEGLGGCMGCSLGYLEDVLLIHKEYIFALDNLKSKSLDKGGGIVVTGQPRICMDILLIMFILLTLVF